jgi:transposase InsO family protein
MSDNSSTYRSKGSAKACKDLGRTSTYTPRTNGKAERYGLRPTASTSRPCAWNGPIGMPFQNPEERNQWLQHYLSTYNRLREHSDLRGQSPQQRLYALLL